MSVALPERSRPPHKVLLVMPDLQIFIISPPDNLIMQGTRIHFAPRRKPARAALSSDYFPALPAALYKPTRTPSIMLLSLRLLGPRLQAPELPCAFCLGCHVCPQVPKAGPPRTPCAHDRPSPLRASGSPHGTFLRPSVLFFVFICLFVLKTCFPKFSSSHACVSVMRHLA